MRKTLLLMTMLVAGLAASSQVSIPGTNATFDFPGGGWKFLQATQVDDNSNVYLFVYAAEAVTDVSGDTVLPCLRIYVRKNYSQSMFKFIMERFKAQPYQSLDEYTDGIPGAEGFGYVAAYTDLVDRKDYEMRMVCFKDKNTVIEFRLEAPMDVYPRFEQSFTDIAATLALTNK